MTKQQVLFASKVIFEGCQWRLVIANASPLYYMWEYCGTMTNGIWTSAKGVPQEVLTDQELLLWFQFTTV